MDTSFSHNNKSSDDNDDYSFSSSGDEEIIYQKETPIENTTTTSSTFFDDSISLIPHFRSKSVLDVEYDVTTNFSKSAWIGLYDVNDSSNKQYLRSQYLKNSNGTITFKSLCEGFYEVRYFPSNKSITHNVAAGSINNGKLINITHNIQDNILTITHDSNNTCFFEIYKEIPTNGDILMQFTGITAQANKTKQVSVDVSKLSGSYSIVAKENKNYVYMFGLKPWKYISRGQKHFSL
ncbi:GOLD domain-containing protein [Entamoeba marina]